MPECICNGNCGKHRPLACKGQAVRKGLCADCLCSCSLGSCAGVDCVLKGTCSKQRQRNCSLCGPCSTGHVHMEKTCKEFRFKNEALQALLCQPAVLCTWGSSNLRGLFRLLVSQQLRCTRCIGTLNGKYSVKRAEHTGKYGCILHRDPKVADTLEAEVARLEQLAKKSKGKANSPEDDVELSDVHDDAGLLLPQNSPLCGPNFLPDKDTDENTKAAEPTGDFLPRSALHYPIGGLSAHVGGESWWRVDCLDERLYTMDTFFDFRAASVDKKRFSHADHRLIKADAGLAYRVNERSRVESPVTRAAYTHYKRHVREPLRPQVQMAELILNAALVRCTLSTRVRKLLFEEDFCYLRLDSTGVAVANFEVLDAVLLRCGGDVFGDFVNPMRKRKKELKEAGWWDLYVELEAIAAEALRLAESFFSCLQSSEDPGSCVETLLSSLQEISGFGGSGFRAKEILCDVLDNAAIFLTTAEAIVVQEAYMEVMVIGVGPCRVCNWLYNKRSCCTTTPLQSRSRNGICLPCVMLLTVCGRSYQTSTRDARGLTSCMNFANSTKS